MYVSERSELKADLARQLASGVADTDKQEAFNDDIMNDVTSLGSVQIADLGMAIYRAPLSERAEAVSNLIRYLDSASTRHVDDKGFSSDDLAYFVSRGVRV